jgi:hypothetical protein
MISQKLNTLYLNGFYRNQTATIQTNRKVAKQSFGVVCGASGGGGGCSALCAGSGGRIKE